MSYDDLTGMTSGVLQENDAIQQNCITMLSGREIDVTSSLPKERGDKISFTHHCQRKEVIK